MIKKFIFMVLPLTLIVISWDANPQDPPCVVMTPTENCSNPPGITIHLKSHKVTPANFCAEAGKTIRVNVVPRNDPVETVQTIAKDPANTWLNGTSASDPKGFELYVPADASGGYDYKVVFSDGYCIDPRISV